MPLFHFYAYIGYNGAKIPLLKLDHFPSDWREMRSLLLDTMRRAHQEYGTIAADISFERHTKQQKKVWRMLAGTYRMMPFSSGRNFEAFFHVVYNPLQNDIVVKKATFSPVSPSHMEMQNDFLEQEKGVKYRVKPIVPKNHRSFIENPRGLFEQESILRYPDYSRSPRQKYMQNIEPKRMNHGRQYLPFGERLEESEERIT